MINSYVTINYHYYYYYYSWYGTIMMVSPGEARVCCLLRGFWEWSEPSTNLCTEILDFRVLDSGRMLFLRGGIFMYMGNLPDFLSQRILTGIIFVGRLGVEGHMGCWGDGGVLRAAAWDCKRPKGCPRSARDRRGV